MQCHETSAANVSVDEVFELLGQQGQATCLWCTLKFTYPEQFIKHVTDHHVGVQPLICTTCWCVFADYESFLAHSVFNLNELRPESSARKRRVAEKTKTVPAGIPFECRKCKKHFRQSCSLFRHRWKCEGTRTIICSICNSIFYRSDHYKRHMVNAHPLLAEAHKRLKDT